MSRIQAYVQEHTILPKDCLYHTQRTTKNKKGEMKGKIRVLVPKATGTAMVEYTCPECGHEAYVEQAWKRPFSVNCERCKTKLSVPKMRDAAKRETKAGRKK